MKNPSKSRNAPPKAGAMLEALRGLGYSTATALADIIDNSIAANASKVDILFKWNGKQSVISVLDDGSGMDDTELDLAMRLPLVRLVDDYATEDGRNGWMPQQHKNGHRPLHNGTENLPPSIVKAIDSFILACAVRRFDGQANEHCSMLVHVTRFNSVQQEVCRQVEEHIRHMRQRLDRNIDHEISLQRLKALRDDPERFMAYNNGIVIVADDAHIGKAADGGPGILWLKGMQIVNGGQTTASIYFTKKKSPDIDLQQVRVPAKLIILRSKDTIAEEVLISDISRYANSQNSVKQSDLSANKPFHVEMEKLAMTSFAM